MAVRTNLAPRRSLVFVREKRASRKSAFSPSRPTAASASRRSSIIGYGTCSTSVSAARAVCSAGPSTARAPATRWPTPMPSSMLPCASSAIRTLPWLALGQGRAPRPPGRRGARVAGAGRPRAAPVRTRLRSRQATRPGPRHAAARAGAALGRLVPHHHARAPVGFRRAGGRDCLRPQSDHSGCGQGVVAHRTGNCDDMELEGLAKRFGPHALAVSLLGVYLYENDPVTAPPLRGCWNNCPVVNPWTACWRVSSGGSSRAPSWKSFTCSVSSTDRRTPAVLAPCAPAAHPRRDRPRGRAERRRWTRARPAGETPAGPSRSRDASPPAIDAHPLLREHFANATPRPAARGLARGTPAALRAPEIQACPTGRKGSPASGRSARRWLTGVKRGCIRRRATRCTGTASSRAPDPTGSTARRSSAPSAPASGRSLVSSRSPGSASPPGCPKRDQASWLLAVAAFNLRALGRLTESSEPISRFSGEMVFTRKAWQGTAHQLRQPESELELTLGELAAACTGREASVELADGSGDAFFRQVFSRTMLADARHQSGPMGGRPRPLP